MIMGQTSNRVNCDFPALADDFNNSPVDLDSSTVHVANNEPNKGYAKRKNNCSLGDRLAKDGMGLCTSAFLVEVLPFSASVNTSFGLTAASVLFSSFFESTPFNLRSTFTTKNKMVIKVNACRMAKIKNPK